MSRGWHQQWRTMLHPSDPDYLDPCEREEELTEPEEEQYEPDIDYQGERE